jgi:hypothetical protein
VGFCTSAPLLSSRLGAAYWRVASGLLWPGYSFPAVLGPLVCFGQRPSLKSKTPWLWPEGLIPEGTYVVGRVMTPPVLIITGVVRCPATLSRLRHGSV